MKTKAQSRERNNGFLQTHQQMIEAATRLIAEKGADALSLAELARELEVNRTTIYYHFKNREQLISEVKQWASQQLTVGLDLKLSEQERIEFLTRFVLDNNELIKLWIGDLLSGADIRQCYPAWDEFVEVMATSYSPPGGGRLADPEVYCLNMLISAFIAPGVFRSSVAPQAGVAEIAARFAAEHKRNLL
ncbi:TetR/AcrR family transcriptional regulator [Haliea sp. E17]|uniref:TetR/AcrR family transcriptional regulator n=1 Tax=Haliea sp. E17 TaxID=3401576 RepID=UPI003AAD0F90